MKLSTHNAAEFLGALDGACAADRSIVLRYAEAVEFSGDPATDAGIRDWLGRVSLGEGARVFPLLTYRGVSLWILDETSRMATRTLKSVDGCVTTAICKQRGDRRTAFESGGNTGAALTRYGNPAGIETFFFCPADNLDLLDSRVFAPAEAHLLAVAEPGKLKSAAAAFARAVGAAHIPERDWRYFASMFRGLFIAEEILRRGSFDWVVQTVSAAFGPIGIYRVLDVFAGELGARPRFLGVQQEENCPMVRAWRRAGERAGDHSLPPTTSLLNRVMYDTAPETYGTREGLLGLLAAVQGALTTVSRGEFDRVLTADPVGREMLEKLGDQGAPITLRGGQVLEKAGLIALVGTLKEIEHGTIQPGARVLCCLTSGCSEGDARAAPEFTVRSLPEDVETYAEKVSAR
jgi:hypothetical protein